MEGQKRKEPLNVVALLLLVAGFPLATVGLWQLGFGLMILGLAVSIVAYIRHRRHRRQA